MKALSGIAIVFLSLLSFAFADGTPTSGPPAGASMPTLQVFDVTGIQAGRSTCYT
jgi:hypothetical protein